MKAGLVELVGWSEFRDVWLGLTHLIAVIEGEMFFLAVLISIVLHFRRLLLDQILKTLWDFLVIQMPVLVERKCQSLRLLIKSVIARLHFLSLSGLLFR